MNSKPEKAVVLHVVDAELPASPQTQRAGASLTILRERPCTLDTMINFCPLCGVRLEEREAFGKLRPVCPACDVVHFENPKVAVGVVVSHLGGIVLGKRDHEPKMGCWSFPSGFVDPGEQLEVAAARECREETGLAVRIERLLGAYSAPGEQVVFIAYAGTAIGGTLEAGDECLEVGIFPPDALPDLAFPHDHAIIEAWSRGAPLPLNI